MQLVKSGKIYKEIRVFLLILNGIYRMVHYSNHREVQTEKG